MRVHIVQHESFEAPGTILTWAQGRKFTVTFSRVFLGDPLPVDDLPDLLVVMGGPQSPATTVVECPHFDSPAEQALIRRCVGAGKAVVGVCLGAQLIGVALGAPHEHSPEKEIGKFPICLTPEGQAHPKLGPFPPMVEVGHWHSDMPGLTSGARVLATSEGCPRQIIEYAPRVFGFQCHLELTSEVVEMLIEASSGDFLVYRDRRFVQQPDLLRVQRWDQMNALLSGFLDLLVAEISGS